MTDKRPASAPQPLTGTYLDQVIHAYTSNNLPLPPHVQRAVATREAVAKAAEEDDKWALESRMADLRANFYAYEDAGWPIKGRGNYRGAHTIRALAIFTGRSVDAIHSELTMAFDTANKDRRKSSAKFERELRSLEGKTEVSNTLVRLWCAAEGLTCEFSKGFGEHGRLLLPDEVPADGLLLLTKDWVAVKDGKIRAAWDPLWHDHRAVNGVWIRP